MRSCEAYCQDPNKALFTQSWDLKRSTTITHHHMTPSPSCHKVSDSITLENTIDCGNMEPIHWSKNFTFNTVHDGFVKSPHNWKYVEFMWNIFHYTRLYHLDAIFMDCLCESDLAGIKFFIINLDYELPPFHLIEDILRLCTQDVLDFLVLHVPSSDLIDMVHLLDFL
ncbi:hypothetical protein BJ741DRAFT_88390 [Chytriomyces cf. hyalinus JEL632]|nr:hypothetical protein BJ741DRAFT_88390 [Chytriomyces cf. hyalinus JEL632]